MDMRPSHPYLSPVIGLTFITGFLLQAAAAQPPNIFIEQIPRTQRIQAPPPVSTPEPIESSGQPQAEQRDGNGGLEVQPDGTIRVSRANVEACTQAATAGTEGPEGVDCVRIMQLIEEERTRTAEGNLLRMVGQDSDVTQPAQRSAFDNADANAIARDAGNAQGDAAAIAARVRGGGPPPQGPR